MDEEPEGASPPGPPGPGKRDLGERLKRWCLVYFCYCSNKTPESGSGNATATQERRESHDSQVTDSRRESNDSQTLTSSLRSRDSHLTRSPQSPRQRLKSVTFSNESEGVHIQDDHPLPPDHPLTPDHTHLTPTRLSPISPEARFLRRQSTEGTIDSMEGVPPEFLSLAGRLSKVMKGKGFGFDQTINEADEQEGEPGEDDSTQHIQLELQVLEKQLRWKISEVESEAENLRLIIRNKLTNGFLPFEFEMTNYSDLRSRRAVYSSPAISSHPGGYRFRIEVLPYGEGMSEGTHLGVNILSMKGDFDPLLKFPATFIVMIQIVNAIADSGNWRREMEVVYQEPGGGREVGSEFEFIELKRLAYNETKNTQYLANDSIRFQITRVLFVS